MMNVDNNALTQHSSLEEINRAIEEHLMCVIYRSRSLVGEDGEQEILKSAHRNNPALGVTGVLVSNSGWFLQVLEGPGMKVKKLLKKIEADTRHSDFYVISKRAIDKRNFQEWSMASVSVDQLRFGQLVKESLSGGNQGLEEVRNFLCYGKWT